MRHPPVSTYRMLSFAAAAATALLVACAPEGELLESVTALCVQDCTGASPVQPSARPALPSS